MQVGGPTGQYHSAIIPQMKILPDEVQAPKQQLDKQIITGILQYFSIAFTWKSIQYIM
jgi:hypothetical protein